MTVCGKDVYVVTAHHFVLFPWSVIRRTRSVAPSLITLDHHTDTMPAFNSYRYVATKGDHDAMNAMLPGLIASIDWSDDASLLTAVSKLRNDEHIRAAVLSGIISRALVINLSGETCSDHDNVYEAGAVCAIGCTKVPHDDACVIKHGEQALESIYLDHELAELNKMVQEDQLPAAEANPYILDIDLDYFHSERSISPDAPETFYRLVRNAIAVTVATEPDYVVDLRDEGSNITSAYLLDRLKDHIRSAMA